MVLHPTREELCFSVEFSELPLNSNDAPMAGDLDLKHMHATRSRNEPRNGSRVIYILHTRLDRLSLHEDLRTNTNVELKGPAVVSLLYPLLHYCPS